MFGFCGYNGNNSTMEISLVKFVCSLSKVILKDCLGHNTTIIEITYSCFSSTNGIIKTWNTSEGESKDISPFHKHVYFCTYMFNIKFLSLNDFGAL